MASTICGRLPRMYFLTLLSIGSLRFLLFNDFQIQHRLSLPFKMGVMRHITSKQSSKELRRNTSQKQLDTKFKSMIWSASSVSPRLHMMCDNYQDSLKLQMHLISASLCKLLFDGDSKMPGPFERC